MTEKPTSPRPPLEDALRELIRVSKGAGMNASSDFGYMPSQQQADEEEISEAVQAVYAAIEREATAATPSIDGSDSLTFLALSQHLDHHTPMAAVRTFPRIDCRCGWEGFDWPVHFYGSTLARLDEGSATPDQGKGEPR